MSFFLSRRSRDNRYSYKAKMFQEGILQNRRGYQPTFDRAISAFANDYYGYCVQHHPTLNPEVVRQRPALSTWFLFHPRGMGRGRKLAHQTTAGFVKLFFEGEAPRIEEIRDRLKPFLNDQIEVLPAHKSVALSARVPPIHGPGERPFAEHHEAVEQALVMAEEIVRIVRQAGVF